MYLAVQVVCAFCTSSGACLEYIVHCGASDVYIALILVHLGLGKCSEPLPGRSSV